MSLRASKRKLPMPCDGAEVVRQNKKALLNGDGDRLNDAIKSGDLLVVREILRNKNRKVSSLCLHNALLKAVEAGKKQIVRLLLSHGVSVEGKSEIGCPALIAAAKQGNLDIVKSLIYSGASIDGQDSFGKTALMTAVENNGCSALITFLLEDCKADVNLQDKDGKTVLMLAVEQWDYETVQILFLGNDDEDERTDYMCDEGIKDKNGHTALDLAKLNGSGGLMNILSECRQQLCSPLTLAAGRNDLGLVRQLVEIHPFCIDRSFGDDPLTSAMLGLEDDEKECDGNLHCSFELIEFLVRAGVDADESLNCGFTPLMLAATAGSVETVNLLLLHEADVNLKSFRRSGHEYFKGRTALMMAADEGNVEVVEILIQAGANLEMEDSDGETALLLAVKGKHKACILALLKKQKVLTVNVTGTMNDYEILNLLLEVKHRWSDLFKGFFALQVALCQAIVRKCYKLVRSLVEHGADFNFEKLFARDEKGKACFIIHSISLATKDIDMLTLLVEMGADVNFRSDSGKTALMHEASLGNTEAVNNLLKCNADMYAENECSTALSMASSKGNVGVVAALLDNGMDINHVSANRTALWSAIMNRQYESAETLIKRGANVDFAGLHGVTILMQAIEGAPLKFSELIIKNGADVNAQDDNGDTALFHALRTLTGKPEDAEEKVSLLLRHGANVNHLNLEMKTPLMVAVSLGRKEICKVVLDSEPELDAQDVNGDTAVHFAVNIGGDFEEELELLASKGADLNIVNNQNRTPLMKAVKRMRLQIVKALIRLGATINKHNSQAVRRIWESDFLFFLRGICREFSGFYFYNEFISLTEALFEKTITLRAAQPPNLDIFLLMFIKLHEFRLLTLLVKFGAGPDTVDLTASGYNVHLDQNVIVNAASVCNLRVSPMCLAILLNQPKTVALFAQICFYDQEDIKILQHPFMQEKLKQMNFDQPNNESCTLDDLSLCPKKWSLRTWSKLAVLRAVGYGEGREQRVRALPIPRPLQDELLYKNVVSLQSGVETV